jgi:valyl-tRNA synthetase
MAYELSPRYDHASAESRWYKIWEDRGAFQPDYCADEKPADAPAFCIVIPPPNVTGHLHVGHALNHTVQDVLTRAARKRGFRTLWLPGTDHAGIATQVLVEKKLKAEGVDRHKLGREKFLEKVWEWKHSSSGAIQQQERRMGFSLDWTRERFTMDEGLSRAVRKCFVDLYNAGLIYRDTRLINWDPAAHTVLSDLEVEYEEGYKGELYSFAYPLSDSARQSMGPNGATEIVVATTRPETMLGDTAIAVHPEDPRYQALIGKTVVHPLLHREVPIIGDAILVDPEFGSGAVKVTPAHDPNDYETGRRHDLEFISIFDESARINERGGKYHGMDRYEARKAVKHALRELGLERGEKEHLMSVGRSQRSGVIVEPMISTQWFVKTKPLAEPGIVAVESGDIRFVPKQWENLFFHWMREIRDWCISRQLWWGHQIPAWHCAECNHVTVALEDPAACESCGSQKLTRDPDVLDTWFSSGLWPFSTLGWPDKTEDLARFYPTTVLVTSFDIIFFWVARMIMMGLYLMKAPPFRDVLIHGLIRDANGEKMSKTKGNVVDPLEASEAHGADAFRFFLIATLAEGKDSNYREDRLKGYQNFANKIWNSTRFVLINLPDDFKPLEPDEILRLPLEAEDFWLLAELNRLIEDATRNLADYKLHLYAEASYAFAWNVFCDWYIEFIKPRMFGKTGADSAEAGRQVAFYALRSLLGILHPSMPFITEELYAHLQHWFKPRVRSEELLISAAWPNVLTLPPAALKPARALALLQEVIGAARQIRGEMNIPPDAKVRIVVRTDNADLAVAVADKSLAVQRLARAESLEVLSAYQGGEQDAMQAFSEGQVFIPLSGVIDLKKEGARLNSERQKLAKTRDALDAKLKNAGFLAKAPVEVVEKEQTKLAELNDKIEAIDASLKRIGA